MPNDPDQRPDCCAAPVGFTIGIILGVPIAELICGWQDAVTNGVMMMLGAFGLWISQKL